MTVNGVDFKAWLDAALALEYTLGSQPGPSRNGAPPNPDLVPQTTQYCSRPLPAGLACGQRPTAPAISRIMW